MRSLEEQRSRGGDVASVDFRSPEPELEGHRVSDSEPEVKISRSWLVRGLQGFAERTGRSWRVGGRWQG